MPIGRAIPPRRLGGALIALGLLLPACVSTSPPRPTPHGGAGSVDVVRVAWQDVGVPNPFRVSTAGPGGAVLVSLIYDTLTWKDEHGIIPWLATAWEVSPDGRDYTFTLAPGVKWQDGQPLTADDVAFSFDYYAQHPYRWTSTDMVESATGLGPDRVRIRLKEPYAPFLENVAGVVPIVPQHVWSQVADPLTYDGPGATLGSGPYRLAEYRSAEGAYRLAANPDYFKGPPRVQEIQQVNTPVETRLQAAQQGQVDLVQSADASVADLVKDNPRLKVIETAPLSVVRLAINTERTPLDRRETRQALAYALDRARIASAVTHGPPVVGSAGVIPPETPWFAPGLPQYPYDVERARALLGGQPTSLELLANPEYREPELIQPMLQAAGIMLNVRRVDGPTKAQLLKEGSFQVAEVQHIGIGGDPDYLRQWYSGTEANDSAQGSIFHDPTFDDLARQQAATIDSGARRQLVSKMQQILADRVPTIPLYYRRFYWVYDSTKVHPMNTWGGLMNGIPFVQNKLIFLRGS